MFFNNYFSIRTILIFCCLSFTFFSKIQCIDDSIVIIRENLNLDECKTRLNVCYEKLNICYKECQTLDKHRLFSSSFISGGIYSSISELVGNILIPQGYSENSAHIISMIIHYSIMGGYTPALTGMAVKVIISNIGIPYQYSAIAGSAASVVSDFSHVILSQEVILNRIVDSTIAIAGSYVGSTLVRQIRSLWTQ